MYTRVLKLGRIVVRLCVLFEMAKDGNLTLKYDNNDPEAAYIHSKYNPIREAQSIIDNCTREKYR